MLSFFKMFLDIAVWRRGPQDAPASMALLAAAACCYVLSSFVQSRMFGFDAGGSAIRTLLDIGMLAAMVAVFLALVGKQARWLQTMIAMTGVGTMLSLLDIAIRTVLAMPALSILITSWELLGLVLLLLTFGRILQQALETGIFAGMALTFAIIVATLSVATFFVDMTPPQSK